MREITKKKLSITLSKDILKIMDDEYYNRSKFIEQIIVNELYKIDKFKEKIDNMIL